MTHFILKTSLRVHEENTKKNHNIFVAVYVTKTRLLYSSDFLKLSLQISVLSDFFFQTVHSAIAKCFKSEKALPLVF